MLWELAGVTNFAETPVERVYREFPTCFMVPRCACHLVLFPLVKKIRPTQKLSATAC